MRVLATALVLTGALALTGCGSSDDDGKAGASATPAPEQVTTSPQAVKVGLGKIVGIAAQIKEQIADKDKATPLDEGIEPIWATIEGTVKKNDADTYIALEDAFALLEDAVSSGDATKATSGAQAVTKAVAAYLAKYPA